jgi:hypothetical protein
LASIEIFIGAPIEHASERAALARAVAFLSAKRMSAVVFANVTLATRQIDLVIGLHQTGTLVIESKALSSAVRGGTNGEWQVRLASGQWRDIPNAYTQAVNEKLALRDAMAAFSGVDVPYPDAAVIFVPAIPAASAIPSSDFKAAIAGLDDLPDRITSARHGGWSLDQWRSFANHHRLISVSSLDMALSPELLHAERLLTTYSEAFMRTYAPLTSKMLPLECACDGETLSSRNVMERTARDGNVLLAGQSGCGKSLLGYAIAVRAVGQGRVPIVISAKDFEGNLREVANREVTLLDASSAAAVISAARLLDRRLLLVVDGYNECTPSERQRLTRSVAAAVYRYRASAVISSRIQLERSDLLPACTYEVQVPSIETKWAIAQQAAGDVSLDEFSELLTSVGSGLEARMIGQLGQRLPTDTSKYALFDAYVRERLGEVATDGIQALSRIAKMMIERISFSLSVRELDRLFDREGMHGSLLRALQRANLLIARGDRVSFSHEMFLNVFAAEAIIRRAGDDPDAVAAALQLPRNLETKPFILGAIDDNSFRRRVLSNLSDTRIIQECLAGQCGHDARLWANMRCDDVLARVAQEIESVQFEFVEEVRWTLRPKPETVQNWTTQDCAVLAVIPHELVAGRRLDEVLSLAGKLDERLDKEHARLLDDAREKKVALRSTLYDVCYAGITKGEIGLRHIVMPLNYGHLYGGPKVAPNANLLERLQSETLSAGQVGLLVALHKYSDDTAPSIGAVLPGILKRLWSTAAHRLRVELMHAAGMSGHALCDDERRVLGACLSSGYSS